MLVTEYEFVRSEIEKTYSRKEKNDRIGLLRNFNEEADDKAKAEIMTIKTYKVEWILGAAAAGGVLGGVAGLFIGKTPSAVALGAGVGVAAGSGIGWKISETRTQTKIIKSPAFQNWKQSVIQSKVYDHFREALYKQLIEIDEQVPSAARSHPFQKLQLICSIAGEVFLVPVKAPCGHIFEKSAIEKHLAVKLPSIMERTDELEVGSKEYEEIRREACPMRCRYFTKEDLVYDEETANTIKVIAEKMMQAPHIQRDPEVREGVAALRDNHRQNLARVGGNRVGAIYERMVLDGASNEDMDIVLQGLVRRRPI